PGRERDGSGCRLHPSPTRRTEWPGPLPRRGRAPRRLTEIPCSSTRSIAGVLFQDHAETRLSEQQAEPAGVRAVLLLLCAALQAACVSSLGDANGGGGIAIETVPTPPAYVSGGDALIRVIGPPELDLSRITVSVNGEPVEEGTFRPAPPDRLGRSGNALLGLVTDLAEGENEVVASVDGEDVATLRVTNYPITGPIFSGPDLEPYFCLGDLQPAEDGAPRRFEIGNGEFLSGPALDAD